MTKYPTAQARRKVENRKIKDRGFLAREGRFGISMIRASLGIWVLGYFVISSVTLFADDARKDDSIHDFTVKSITGEEVKLSDFGGKTVLIVNVASECGVTDQYEVLQALYEVLKDRNFTVLGFPTNEFGGQEPGTNEEIAAFCKKEYSVTFPMFAKIVTNGEKQIPLFKYLTNAESPDEKGPVGWNFEKFLVGKDGKLLRRFGSQVEPDSPEMIAAIKEAISEKAGK